METVYVGDFQCLNDLVQAFHLDAGERKHLTESTVVYAAYHAPSLENKAFVLYHFRGWWCEIYASDHPFHGLDGQWDPVETTLTSAHSGGTVDVRDSAGAAPRRAEPPQTQYHCHYAYPTFLDHDSTISLNGQGPALLAWRAPELFGRQTSV